MYNQYLRHTVESIEFKDEPNLPTAIICDIDGTLAYSPDRNVYDYKKLTKIYLTKNLLKF